MDKSTQYDLGYEKGREDGRNITAEIEARYAESCEKYKAEIAVPIVMIGMQESKKREFKNIRSQNLERKRIIGLSG